MFSREKELMELLKNNEISDGEFEKRLAQIME